MDIAIAMKYGGDPVTADECDESSYLKMGLLCPCKDCNDVVRWVAPQDKTSIKGKEFSVKSHFAHFKAKDPVLKQQCEERVNNLKKSDLEKMARRAIQQRSALFQRWFWEVLNAHIIRCDLTPDWDMREYLFLTGEFSNYRPGEKFDKIILEYNQKYKPIAQKEAEHFFEAMELYDDFKLLVDSINPPILSPDEPESEDKTMSQWTGQIQRLANSRLHRQITKEALDFLGTKRNYALRNALLIWLYTFGNEHIKGYFSLDADDLGYKLYPMIGQMFAVIPWADEFDDLSKGKPLTQRSLAGAILMYILNTVEENSETANESAKSIISI